MLNWVTDLVAALNSIAQAILASNPNFNNNPYKFSVYRAGAQNALAGGFTKIQHETKTFDTNSNFDATTNFRYVAPVDGYYWFYGRVSVSMTTNDTHISAIYINGVAKAWGSRGVAASADIGSYVGKLIKMSAGDYAEHYVYNGGAANKAIDVGTEEQTYFGGYLVSKS